LKEWLTVFDEPMLGQSALDRFCHRAHQFVIEGESYETHRAGIAAYAEKQPESHDLNPRGGLEKMEPRLI
jgi:IstB-like ATP binding protein